MENKNNSKKLDLKELFFIIISKWYIFAAVLVVCVLASMIYSYFIVTPLYDSTGKLYIMNKSSDTINSSDLSVSSYLTRDYENLIVDRAVLDEVSDELNDKYSYSQLKSAVSVFNPENTRFIEITVRTPIAADSKKIVDLICEISQEKIVELLGIDQVTIVRTGDIASSPSVPNIRGNLLKGVFAAVVIYILVICAIYFLNDKINGPEEVEKFLEISVLGNIPYNQTKSKSKIK